MNVFTELIGDQEVVYTYNAIKRGDKPWNIYWSYEIRAEDGLLIAMIGAFPSLSDVRNGARKQIAFNNEVR